MDRFRRRQSLYTSLFSQYRTSGQGSKAQLTEAVRMTKREREIIQRISKGWSTKEIA